MDFAKSSFGQFLARGAGRVARAVLGIMLIAIGVWIGGVGGIALIVVGVLPLLGGLIDVCFDPFVRRTVPRRECSIAGSEGLARRRV